MNMTIRTRLILMVAWGFLMGCQSQNKVNPPHSGSSSTSSLEKSAIGQKGTRSSNGQVQTDLFLNPFNQWSAHHRPVGKGATYGIPGTTGTPTRGRLDKVTLFRAGASPQGRKYIHRVRPTDGERTIQYREGEFKSGSLLTITEKFPKGKYPPPDGDSNVILWPKNGEQKDVCELFYQWKDPESKATLRRSWPLAGTDVSDGSDVFDNGSSASWLRWPGTILRGFEINPENPAPIQHCLNVTATRHSRVGAPASCHVLGKSKVWPAYSTDHGSGNPENNLGDIPYGTRLVIRWQDRNLRDQLGLSPRGKVLFDTMLYYGIYVVDGQGQYDKAHDGGVLQLRLDHEVEPIGDINESLMKILPYLWPMRNPRPLDRETEIGSDGLPYAGGGGPLDPLHSINTAWDAPRAAGHDK